MPGEKTGGDGSMGREQALEMMNDVLLSERDHLRAVNADLMDALETLYS